MIELMNKSEKFKLELLIVSLKSGSQETFYSQRHESRLVQDVLQDVYEVTGTQYESLGALQQEEKYYLRNIAYKMFAFYASQSKCVAMISQILEDFRSDGHCHLNKIEDALHISRSTAYRRIQEINDVFSNYDLRFDLKENSIVLAGHPLNCLYHSYRFIKLFTPRQFTLADLMMIQCHYQNATSVLGQYSLFINTDKASFINIPIDQVLHDTFQLNQTLYSSEVHDRILNLYMQTDIDHVHTMERIKHQIASYYGWTNETLDVTELLVIYTLCENIVVGESMLHEQLQTLFESNVHDINVEALLSSYELPQSFLNFLALTMPFKPTHLPKVSIYLDFAYDFILRDQIQTELSHIYNPSLIEFVFEPTSAALIITDSFTVGVDRLKDTVIVSTVTGGRVSALTSISQLLIEKQMRGGH
ncbi:helix-turn-helix domain-containing protein [Erysipelothrix sp. P66]|uniref:helix-turn-helix domain-containing protein n=1 Tax=Erysipelothrix sp. P66 TaxID=3141531 RepID=UPI00315CD2A5